MPFVLERSGNPGYIRGQPVLAGSLTDTYPTYIISVHQSHG